MYSGVRRKINRWCMKRRVVRYIWHKVLVPSLKTFMIGKKRIFGLGRMSKIVPLVLGTKVNSMASRVKGLVCLWHHEHGSTYRSHDFSGGGRSRVLVSWRSTRDATSRRRVPWLATPCYLLSFPIFQEVRRVTLGRKPNVIIYGYRKYLDFGISNPNFLMLIFQLPFSNSNFLIPIVHSNFSVIVFQLQLQFCDFGFPISIIQF